MSGIHSKYEYSYKKAAILISNFCHKTDNAFDLFDKPKLRKVSSKLMEAIDKINCNYGGRTVFYASRGEAQGWLPKSNMKSVSYTSNWKDVIKVS
jgi:DNA polymerase V